MTTSFSKQDILNKLGLLYNNSISNPADVMFCKKCGLEVQLATFATEVRLTFNDIKRYDGTILELIQLSETYIRNNINWRVVLDGSMERQEIPEVPLDAIREALVNSFCHRDFTMNQNNEITIHKDRIEIYNPGRFPDGLVPEDFIDGSERSVKRNPNLSQLLYFSRDIESFGTGLRRIKTSCVEAGIDVFFELLKSGFVVKFIRQNTNVPQNHETAKLPITADKIIKYLLDCVDKRLNVCYKSVVGGVIYGTNTQTTRHKRSSMVSHRASFAWSSWGMG